MDQRISIITLGVEDLGAMKKFYTEKFGWTIEAQAKDIVFFKLNGLLLGLYGRENMAAAQGKSPKGEGFRPLVIAYMVNDEQTVNEMYKDFKAKGIATLTKPEAPFFGGLFFLAEDIEGNVWEIASNPLMTLDKNGNVTSHKNIDNL